MSATDFEKSPASGEAEVQQLGRTDTAPTDEEKTTLVNGDDALKLAGAQASQFDEKYYARLRWKIVSQLGRKF